MGGGHNLREMGGQIIGSMGNGLTHKRVQDSRVQVGGEMLLCGILEASLVKLELGHTFQEFVEKLTMWDRILRSFLMSHCICLYS